MQSVYLIFQSILTTVAFWDYNYLWQVQELMIWMALFKYRQYFTSALKVIIKEVTLKQPILLSSGEYKYLTDNFMYSLKAY